MKMKDRNIWLKRETNTEVMVKATRDEKKAKRAGAVTIGRIRGRRECVVLS